MGTVPVRQILGGRYRLDRVVAESAGATVFEAFHLTLGIKVAVKVLRRAAADREAIAREVEALRRIASEHVVRPIDVGLARVDEATELPFLALEWCDGGSLTEVAKRRLGGEPDPLRVVDLMLPVVDAIGAVHRAGITHGDIKPSNILFVTVAGGELSPRVIDFGSAAMRGRGPTGDFSAPYAAPEQVRGGPIGAFTDVHALGLVLTELITGRAPYGELGAIAAVDAVRPTPARFGIDCGPVERVIAQALSLEPGARHRDASELASALREASSVQRPVPRPAPAAPSRRAMIGAGAAVTLGLGALAFGRFRLSRRETASATTPSRGASAALSSAPTARELLEHVRAQAARAGFHPGVRSTDERLVVERAGAVWSAFVEEPVGPIREALAEIVWDYRDNAVSMAYGIVQSRALLISGPHHPAPARRVFEELTEGLSFELAGEALSMDEPTTMASLLQTVPVVAASRVRELSLAELERRVRDARATVEFCSRPRAGHVHAMIAGERGVCSIAGGRRGGDDLSASSAMDAKRLDHEDFVFAQDGDAAVFSDGAAPFLEPSFLERVVAGLGATVQRG